jgi:lipopolysaccharide export system permease protein
MLLKTLDKLVLKSFVGPYVFSFFVAEFVLVMQFLWKYIDELVGKGLSFWFLVELVFYYAVTIVPLSVPITILISSVMVYGNMAEKYEISSFKSAGVSLMRVMRPGIMLALFTFSFSLLASNYLKPKANLKFYQAFENVRKQKPSLTIEQGIFNDDFKGFSIKVGKKLADDINIEDVMIYDNSNRSFLNLTTAEKGKMYTISNGKYFIMELEDVQQYRELLDNDKNNQNQSTAFLRSQFKTWKKTFDMSEFEFSERTSGLARRKYDLYNSLQLMRGIDTINRDLVKISFRNKYPFDDLGFIDIDSTALKKVEDIEKAGNAGNPDLSSYDEIPLQAEKAKTATKPIQNKSVILSNKGNNLTKLNQKLKTLKQNKPIIFEEKPVKKEVLVLFNENVDHDTVQTLTWLLPKNLASSIIFRALNSSQTVNEKVKASMNEGRMKTINKRKYQLRFHQIYSWAVVCIIFMFIGAPLGSIVRKGGYGYPLLIAIVFFMVFIILMIMGEKLNKSQSLSAWLAAWLPCLVLFPISVILSYLALGDVTSLKLTWISDFFSRFKKET